MAEPIAYLNGTFVPASQAVVSVADTGFLLGVTVAEQLRTFRGRLFRVEEHLARLARSLAIVGVDSGHSPDELARLAEEIVKHNHGLLRPGDDLALTLFVTPGISASMATGGERVGPTICLHTRPLPFRLWADKYCEGEALATTDFEQVSPRSWPPELKCRSRMHFHLADHQANSRFPESRALMLDEDGYVTEATTANVLIYRDRVGLLAPPAEKVLPGISLSVLKELAGELRIPFEERDLLPADIAHANEVFLCSTSPCVLPVTRFNGQPIGTGKPGRTHEALLTAWSKRVGLDIAYQAQQFAALEFRL